MIRRVADLALAAALAGWLAHAVLSVPAPTTSLPALVAPAMPSSGVEHPVTAVLLAFRAYDTLLEVGVLLIAALAARAVLPTAPTATASAAAPARRTPRFAVALEGLVPVLVPLVLLVVAWVVWAGKFRPGGAFQAAALLAAAAVLLRLADLGAPLAHGVPRERAVLAAGLVAFIAVAASGPLLGVTWLAYPAGSAGQIILALELVLTVSIAGALYVLFVSGGAAGVPDATTSPPSAASPRAASRAAAPDEAGTT